MPLIKPAQGKVNKSESEPEATIDQEEVFLDTEVTVKRKTPHGVLSLDAVISIEQFARYTLMLLYKLVAEDTSQKLGR